MANTRNLINITDLTVEEIDKLIATADDIVANHADYEDICRHKKLATLFFEPSTRTRLSFEAAMLELGGSVLGAGSFAVFFGGTIWDGLAAAVFALAVCFLQNRLGRTQVNTAAFNLVISLLIGLGVGLAVILLPTLHMDKILIGDIMLLIPGLAMTNAIRNTLLGNTISGVVRLAESLIWAAALAGGFMVALVIVGLLP